MPEPMSEDIRKCWRLMEPFDNGFLTLEWHSFPLDSWICCLQLVEINPMPVRWKIKESASRHMKIVINSLLANKERFADGELDYSALSPETCEALRGLGVEIPISIKDVAQGVL